MPRRGNFPDSPVTLEPPEAGARVGISVPEPLAGDFPRTFNARLIALFLVLGGGWAFVHPVGMVIGSKGACCFWPFLALEPIWGVVAIVRGTQIFAAKQRPRIPILLVLLQIHLSGCFDLVNCLLGVLNLLMLCAPNTRRYFRNEWGE